MPRVFTPALLALMMLLAGCALAPATGLLVRSTGGTNGPTGYEVVEQTEELKGVLEVVRAVGRTETGERIAQIDVRNISGRALELEYQFRWRDQFGSEFPTLWEWRHIGVPAGRTVRLEDEVVDSEWVHYTCEMRLAKP